MKALQKKEMAKLEGSKVQRTADLREKRETLDKYNYELIIISKEQEAMQKKKDV